MSGIKLKNGLMQKKKRDGIVNVARALAKQPLRSTETTTIHKRKVMVEVDAECVVHTGGVVILVNGEDGDHYKNFVSDDLLSFLDETATKVQKEVEALKDKDDVALIEKAEALAEKINKE